MWSAEALAENKRKAIWLSAFVIGGLGISHNISALLLFGFFFAYSLVLSVSKKSALPFLRSVISFGLGLCLAAFFFIPALAEKGITFLDQTIAKDYPDHFVYLQQLVKGGWGYGSSVAGIQDGLSFSLGWVHVAGVVIALVFLASQFLRKKHSSKIQNQNIDLVLVVFSFLILLGSIFFMLPISKIFWDHLPLLPFVQFPWRFLMLTVPVTAVLSAIGLDSLTNKLRFWPLKKWLLVTFCTLVTLLLAQSQWHLNQPLVAKQVSGDALEGSTTWADEQATKWFLPKPHQIPAQKVEALSPTALVGLGSWKTQYHEYLVKAKEPTKVVENTMYYPGWEVFVNGKEVKIDYQDASYPGRIVYTVNSGDNFVITHMGETPLRKAMDILSVVSFCVCLFFAAKSSSPSATQIKPSFIRKK
jgi:hypothetical protein